jgi:hypothetical protein
MAAPLPGVGLLPEVCGRKRSTRAPSYCGKAWFSLFATVLRWEGGGGGVKLDEPAHIKTLSKQQTL